MSINESPLVGWTDFSLIPDDTCHYVLTEYARRRMGITGGFDAIVIDDDQTKMWNLQSSLNVTNGNIGKLLTETRLPFWVDDNGIVHQLSDEITDEKTVFNLVPKPNEPSYDEIKRLVETGRNEDELRKIMFEIKSNAQKTIKILPAKNLSRALNENPNVRLLVIDGINEFLSHNRQKYPNVWFSFTSAPTNLTPDREERFYELLNGQTERLDRLLNQGLEEKKNETENEKDNDDTDSWNRYEYYGWNTFVPSIDYLPNNYDDIRVTSTHLTEDGTSKLFWRNIVYTVLSDGDETKKTKKKALVIRLRLDLCRDEYLTKTTNSSLAIVRRFKKFLAYLVRVYRIIADEQRANKDTTPHVYWTCCQEETGYFMTLRKLLTREYIIGSREKIGNHDRYIQLNAQIRSNCAINTRNEVNVDDPWPIKQTEDERAGKRKNHENVQGVLFETLVDQHWFHTKVCRIGQSTVFLQQHRNCLPITHLRDYES